MVCGPNAHIARAQCRSRLACLQNGAHDVFGIRRCGCHDATRSCGNSVHLVAGKAGLEGEDLPKGISTNIIKERKPILSIREARCCRTGRHAMRARDVKERGRKKPRPKLVAHPATISYTVRRASWGDVAHASDDEYPWPHSHTVQHTRPTLIAFPRALPPRLQPLSSRFLSERQIFWPKHHLRETILSALRGRDQDYCCAACV